VDHSFKNKKKKSSVTMQNSLTCSRAHSAPTQATSKHTDSLDRRPTAVASSDTGLTVLVAGEELALNSEPGRALIEDVARYTEGLLDEDGLGGAWGMRPGELSALKNNQDVFEAVRAIKHRREQDGSAAREAGRRAFLKAPRVLEQILDDPYSPTRAKIEASRELRAVAGFSPDQPSDASRTFQVVINLGGGDVKQFQLTGRASREDGDIVDVTPCPITEHISVPRSNEDE
jgi:hypothetical protein